MPLAARKAVWVLVAVVRKRKADEHLVHAGVHLLAGDAEIFQPEGNLARHGARNNLVVGILEDQAHLPANTRNVLAVGGTAAVDGHPAGCRQQQAIEAAQEGGLARAVGTHQGDKLTRQEAKGDVVQYRRGAAGVGVRDILNVDHKGR